MNLGRAFKNSIPILTGGLIAPIICSQIFGVPLTDIPTVLLFVVTLSIPALLYSSCMFILIRYSQAHCRLHRNNIVNAIFFSLLGSCVGAFASFTTPWVWFSPKEIPDAFGFLMLVGAFLGAVTSIPIFLTMRRKEDYTV